MKKILGLDLGTNSIGWAVVLEGDNNKSSIVKLGVRRISYDTFTKADGKEIKGNPTDSFSRGESVTPNALRTQKRGMRRNLQRYKLRRHLLIKILEQHNIINSAVTFNEFGPNSTYDTMSLRAKAALDEISLEEFAKVLLNINKQRGYKSNRKVKRLEDGNIVDGMSIARQMNESNLTPGQFVFARLLNNDYHIPDFYRSDLLKEFNLIWDIQKNYYPNILTDVLKDEFFGKNKAQVWQICLKAFQINGVKRDFRGKDLLKENYRLRCEAIKTKLSLENLAVVFQEINGQIAMSSGLLGEMSDRSQFLYFNKKTVGQWKYEHILANRHNSLKNKSFFRQDYVDEFNQIWDVQSRFHPELTYELKTEIRDKIIFYQRPLKSQKNQVSICEFERKKIKITKDGKEKVKEIGLRVCPVSSPLFQEFKIYQILNNLKVEGKFIEQEQKELLFNELSVKGKLTDKEVLKLLYSNHKDLSLNYKVVEGNYTQSILFQTYLKILEGVGYDKYDFFKHSAHDSIEFVCDAFNKLGWRTDFLSFDSSLDSNEYQMQPMYRLWHLLYSYEGDNSLSGIDGLLISIRELTGMDIESARILASVSFKSGYGRLCSKAIKKILPFLRDGNDYSLACAYAGYRHSASSLTKEEVGSCKYAGKITLLPKNSLRNPIVEKVLNQMANVVNEVINKYGKPDEIRIEMARELKKSADERQKLSDAIAKSTSENERYRKILQTQFNIENPTRNDILRYRLYLELEFNGFHTLYSNTYISPIRLFPPYSDFNVEHIIPKAKLFDDSFSNKTLECTQINIEKSNLTAYDYVARSHSEDYVRDYEARVEMLYKKRAISKTKRDKLFMKGVDIPQGFIERDLRDTQYISKMAVRMLQEVVPYVVSTTGAVTERLRKDWQLIDVMKELNWNKYDRLGMTYYFEDRNGRKIPKIKDWTKRNDHRHHAMDALAIAFTKRSYIQYLNNLNARIDKGEYDGTYVDLSKYGISDIPKEQRTSAVTWIEKNHMFRDSKGRLRFKPPMPLDEFRNEAKAKLEEILVSIKPKGKLITKRVIKVAKGGETKQVVAMTPRGQLHNETFYGRILLPKDKEDKIDAKFSYEKIAMVISPRYRNALIARLDVFGGDSKKAFTGKNALANNPIWLDENHTEALPLSVRLYEPIYTKRESITKELNIGNVINDRVKNILMNRLAEFGGERDKAFVNLDKNPIWLDKEKGISIKKVTVKAMSTVIPLHDKKDNSGALIVDDNGNTIPTDFVSTNNNHHVAIYLDEKGKYQERVVSFIEAVSRAIDGGLVIDNFYNNDRGWTFQFSMRINEYFVFPNADTGFDPNDYDLLDPANYAIISSNLFRVQSLSTKDYYFRHHLESSLNNDDNLRNITWKRIRSADSLKGVVKVRINHLGEIVKVGE